ncbi:hypothetical protein S40285_08944 [Stachybotrys chlorohalonatus IBT 40285]|uniref:Proteasome assembly chaperone 3 n=1 Tax=Stachybotrys chlorohalonatus (strain IBT 40285) TaxID=1283841 RepID=A0A084QC39_STAC4|nr:hypothetical protein S40285_08944 [Stachybotrys chlorohalonata IBT 40285]
MAKASGQVIEFSIPFPHSLDTRIHLRLATQAKAIMLSLTTASQDEIGAATSLGSFVYALPDRIQNQQPLATTLFSYEATVEFTTRLAKLLARKTQLPIYVSNSMSFANAGMGGTVEEEMEAFKSIVQVTLSKLRDAGVGPLASRENAASLS